jgi:peptidoglycan/xylan/chitin deacetylase (PgdA/CDA1 family)
MIYLTGDVHTKSMGGWEQEKMGSEVVAAKKYLEILKKYNLSCTLFINGKCFEEEKEKVKELLSYDVEFGGHTYNNFGKLGIIKSYLYRKLFGCVYGSKHFQTKDILKTKKTFEKVGLKMVSWRTHAFGSNEETFKILRQAGVRYVSDLVGDIKPFEKGEIIHLPINLPVDGNTLSYGEFRPENRNPFASCTKGRISAEEWFEILKKRITHNEKNKINSIILIHPITMAALDNFELFEQIAKFFSKYKSSKISNFHL